MLEDSGDANSVRTGWPARLIGVLLFALGLVLAIGGIVLLTAGGSPYYLLAGLGLIASGALLFLRRWVGAVLYAVIFALTAAWAFWESSNVWGLVPRLVGPAILLVLVCLITPFLVRRTGWKPAILGAVGTLVFTGAAFWLTALAAPGWGKADLPNHGGSIAGQSVNADWPAWGGTYGAQRYSTLAQITPDNVDQLKVAWTAHTGDLPQGAGEGKYAAETTPLKVGNRLYMCTAMNQMLALDANNGKVLWRYDPGVSTDAIPYSASCRGVTAFDPTKGSAALDNNTARPTPAQVASTPITGPATALEECTGLRILEATLDARLIEVDADTGKPCPGFGTNGEVDTTVGLGNVYPGMAAMTVAPTIVNGTIVVGRQVMDGQRNDAPSGAIMAFDATTGERKWAWDMGRPGETGWPADGEEFTRGTPNMWTSAAGDDDLNMVYLPLGNSSSDYWSSDRSAEENKYSSALVAIDVATGKPAWTFQTVHKDVWDYDLGSQPTLVDLPDGTPALVLASKQGEIYVLDRRTGKPLHRVIEKPAPTGGAEPEQRSPTQPYSAFATLKKPNLTEADMWGMSPIDQMICRIQYRKADYAGYYTPPSENHSIEYPGYNGGSDWGSVAVDPARGVIVANYNDMPNYVQLVPRAVADKKGWEPRGPQGNTGGGKAEGAGDPQAGVPYAIDVNAGWRMPFTGLLCKQPPYGGITAIDLTTGKTIWDRPFGTARKNGPFGIASHLPVTIGTPNNGGAVVTAGGLIFVAATTDDLIHAIDLQTGKMLWTAALPGGGQANVMTYEEGGRQYVVVMAGGHHFMQTKVSDAVVAYALPDTTT